MEITTVPPKPTRPAVHIELTADEAELLCEIAYRGTDSVANTATPISHFLDDLSDALADAGVPLLHRYAPKMSAKSPGFIVWSPEEE